MTNSPSAKPRLPRYSRALRPPPIDLTDRDLDLIATVADFRFLTSRQLQTRLFSTSTASSCRRRLTLLYHNGYLDRRHLPLRSAYGASQAVYCLARRGADALRFLKNVDLSWRPKDNDRELYFLEHLLATNDVRLVLEPAASAVGLELVWIDERDLRSRGQRRASTSELPTAIFDGLALLDGRGVSEALAIELDRGTVEERPFRRKVEAILSNLRAGNFQPDIGDRPLRVLFVCTPTQRDRQRLDRIKGWTEKTNGGGHFWFAPYEGLGPETLLQTPIWQVARREGLWPLFASKTDSK